MLQRKNLLLVEDDTIVLSALCELLLASDEYFITKAKNCDDVHLFFKDNHFDLVILNPKMLKASVQNFLDLLFQVGFSGPIIFSCSFLAITIVDPLWSIEPYLPMEELFSFKCSIFKFTFLVVSKISLLKKI